MPVCKNCGKSFPNWAMIDGVKRNAASRKYCYECSPYGLHNTRPISGRLGEFSGECVCSTCGRLYTFDRKKGHTKQRCNSCLVNDRRFKLKQRCVEYKGGKCADCGYHGNIKVLNFHHTDPKEKEFQISGSHCRSWDNIRKELEKCVLLCANCHVIRHDEKDNTPIA